MNRDKPFSEGNPAEVLVRAMAGDGNLSHLIGAAVRLRDNKFAGYRIRGKWLQDDRYAPLRNAAWLVTNSRVGQGNNPLALALAVVVAEFDKLTGAGEKLLDVVEALCELLVHP